LELAEEEEIAVVATGGTVTTRVLGILQAREKRNP
jgi:hypothetical protein